DCFAEFEDCGEPAWNDDSQSYESRRSCVIRSCSCDFDYTTARKSTGRTGGWEESETIPHFSLPASSPRGLFKDIPPLAVFLGPPSRFGTGVRVEVQDLPAAERFVRKNVPGVMRGDEDSKHVKVARLETAAASTQQRHLIEKAAIVHDARSVD